ncbi:hypothetical protein [Palleronia caenipelagi]|uniref:Uncharacterized protein n=1 Tax=Palleronia caenipelagi TaxID=2489174 RepID=A0A547PS57_9RHOB|nr:hypothetical protein [Palleronia caenipelagi]TRD16970.1 hypothetical protein FEV53_13620 [Palleronia caenipelagi]
MSTALQDAITALNTTRDAYHGLIGELRDAVPQMSRIFDDTNPTVAYPGGTSIADATVTHSAVYTSKFPGRASQIGFAWFTWVRLDCPENQNPLAKLFVTRGDGTKLTDEVHLGYQGPTTGSDVLMCNAGGTALFGRDATEANITLQLRCYMTSGAVGSAATALVDKLELLIWEVAENG